MRINKIILRNFRNIINQQICFSENVNILTGLNAQGKTNLLESVCVAAFGRSHRTSVDEEMINFDSDSAAVEVFFFFYDVENNILINLNRYEKKQFKLNEHTVKARELMGNINLVMFSPDDLLLIKGPPSLRRKFIDLEISQTSKFYYKDLLQYNRIVQRRNTLLKRIYERNINKSQLETWDEQLSVKAASLVKKRKEALRKLAMLASLMNRRLTDSKENLATQYYQPYFIKGEDDFENTLNPEWYLKKLKETIDIDLSRKMTTIGPHRDDIIFLNNGINLRNYGSQGQQRTGVLAFKLAELEYIKSEVGEYPVLLLDDVMSELDEQRREQLINFVRDKIQTFITTTDINIFKNPKFTKFYIVKKGNITE